MANNSKNEDLLKTARNHFQKNDYQLAEPLLNQIILKNNKDPEVFHMLGTIYYDQGKFNKAIRAFKRAIEVNPSYTDASIGLSIIYNDLGKYEDGQQVFEEARKLLDMQNQNNNHFQQEKLATKHDELGEMYFQCGQFKDALEQYKKSLELSNRTAEITMNIVRCYESLEEFKLAVRMLKELCNEYPNFTPARLKLGKLYYETRQIPEAVEQWERVLHLDPDNKIAQDYLQLANSVQVTHLRGREIEL